VVSKIVTKVSRPKGIVRLMRLCISAKGDSNADMKAVIRATSTSVDLTFMSEHMYKFS
jgi:hypothetical protein